MVLDHSEVTLDLSLVMLDHSNVTVDASDMVCVYEKVTLGFGKLNLVGRR